MLIVCHTPPSEAISFYWGLCIFSYRAGIFFFLANFTTFEDNHDHPWAKKIQNTPAW